ncbi:hypothetical protein CGSMWGv00703C2mash_04010, partial [Gardnerella pickettii 00703C2mash]
MTTAKLDYTLTISEWQAGGLGTGHEREQTEETIIKINNLTIIMI